MRMVIKVGTSTLTHPTGCVNIRRMESLCKVISDLAGAGHEIVLVSSGAIGMGVGKLHMKERPCDLATKQAAAAVGQCELMYCYDRAFGVYNQTVAQILLTAPDLHEQTRLEKFQNTVERLLSLSVLPIINENDTVATEEIEFGDNDSLAAEVAAEIRAELLVLLSDIDGLYDKNPHTHRDAALIGEVYAVDERLLSFADGKGTLGTGGMTTKLKAAKRVMTAGCDMVIMNGASPELLYELVDGKPIGTRFFARGVK